jgi:hypothetical protein
MQITIPVPVVTGPVDDEVDPESGIEDQLDFVRVSLVTMAVSRCVRRRSVAAPLPVNRRCPLRVDVVGTAA